MFEIDQKIEVRCIARDGRPAAKLSWFLDNEPITDNLSSEQPTESLASNNQTLYTAQQTMTRYIRAGDDHKTITCRATAIGKTQDTHLQLQVKCEYRGMVTTMNDRKIDIREISNSADIPSTHHPLRS